MSFQIKDSLSVQFTKAPAISIAGPSGSGKTESAMRLARGYCGKEKFLVIDTEEKRALYKKARYQPWDWMDFQPPFTPEAYVEALEAAKGYKAVVLDSGSHEYAGPGGLQDIHQATLERMAKGNESRMEALSGPAWKDAKMRHKSVLMSYLIRYPTMLIVCLRAEPKVKFVKDDKGKMQIVDAGYVPICEKLFMYEMLVGCMMTAEEAGVPQHIKRLEPDLEPIFLPGKQIDESTGERLAAWAADRKAPVDTGINAALQEIGNAGTLDSLKTAFGRAYTRAKKSGDTSDMTMLQNAYDKAKDNFTAPQEAAINSDEEPTI
jgi:hypothetical protein